MSYQAPIQYEEVPVPRPTDLRWIASAARVSMKEIQQLNPGLRRWRTPPKYPGYKIKVPPGTARQVAAAVRDWRPNLFAGRKYRIQRGDTLGRIARNLGTTVEALAEINGLSDPGRIYVGQNLILPAETQTAAKRKGSTPPGGPKLGGSPEERPSVHIVRSGETLWGISRRYGVSFGNLISWNRLPKDGRIRPGDKIRLSPEGFLEPKSSRLKRPSLFQGG